MYLYLFIFFASVKIPKVMQIFLHAKKNKKIMEIIFQKSQKT
eukprot:UN24095